MNILGPLRIFRQRRAAEKTARTQLALQELLAVAHPKPSEYEREIEDWERIIALNSDYTLKGPLESRQYEDSHPIVNPLEDLI
jgi:hypothetical protein